MKLTGKRNCPDEATILAFTNKKLSDRSRAGVAKHLVKCEDCRETIALFAPVQSELFEAGVAAGKKVEQELASDQVVASQASAVIQMIAKNEERQPGMIAALLKSISNFIVNIQTAQASAIAAVAVIVIAAAVFLPSMLRASPFDSASKLVNEIGNTVEVRLTGLPYASSSVQMGEATENVKLELARRYAEQAVAESGSKEARLIAFQANLLSHKPDQALEAIKTVELSAETLNETGAAYYLTGDYERAYEQFKHSLELDPEFDEALFNTAMTLRQQATGAVPQQRRRLLEEARASWQRYIHSAADDLWKEKALEYLGEIERELGPSK